MATQHKAGEIRGDAVYRLDAFGELTGLGPWAIRQAKKDGLRVFYIGRRGFIRGADAMEFFERRAAMAEA